MHIAALATALFPEKIASSASLSRLKAVNLCVIIVHTVLRGESRQSSKLLCIEAFDDARKRRGLGLGVAAIRRYQLTLLWQFSFGGIGEEFLTVWASLGGRPREEVEDGLPDGRHAWLWRWSPDSFFPSRCFKAAGLEEGVSDHGH
jgi:hypothetical protein